MKKKEGLVIDSSVVTKWFLIQDWSDLDIIARDEFAIKVVFRATTLFKHTVFLDP
jgi:hypothetical protein